MAYTETVYRYGNITEYEYKFSGRYGQKGERRGARKKPTPQQIKTQNQWNRKKRLRRKIEANFKKGDPFVCLAYHRSDSPPTMEQMEDDVRYLLRNLRAQYKKQGKELKYICRMEIGKRGGRHVHILMNYIDNCLPLISKYWRGRRPNIEESYDLESGQLADYLSKQPDEEIEGQMSFLPEKERKKFIRYSCSKNLVIPEPEKHVYSHRTVLKMIRDGITPKRGHEIIKDSIRHFINPYTGYTHLYYKERACKGTGETLKLAERSRPPWEDSDGKYLY